MCEKEFFCWVCSHIRDQLDDNFHTDKANINMVPSEMASYLEDPLL
jgi:hypothetical protein